LRSASLSAPPKLPAGDPLVYCSQKSPSNYKECPRRPGFKLLNVRTGELRAAMCLSLKCPVCVRVCAMRYGNAIGMARPERQILLTGLPDDWEGVKRSMTAFRRVVRKMTVAWKDCYHVERNPRATGLHAHLWQWGSPVEVPIVAEAAVRAGLGSFVDVQARRSPPGAPLRYGMKVVVEGSPMGQAVPPLTQDYLNINGGRLVHATPGFWRDDDGRKIAGVQLAARTASRGSDHWVAVRA
jgi:hypothetical protein